MRPRALATATTLLLLLAPAPGARAQAGAASAAPPEATVAVPASMTTRNVPAIAAAPLAALEPYENLRSARFQDWHPSERRMLLTTRFGETTQLHEVAAPLGARTQVTFLPDRVNGGAYRPGSASEVVFSIDPGGAENYQLLTLDRATGDARRFTDGTHRYEGFRFSRDGSLLAYTANSRNGRDFDLYVADPARLGSERRVAELSGVWGVLDWSPDGRRLLLQEYLSETESYLDVFDLASGARRELTPRQAGSVASYEGGRWSSDGASIYTATDRGGELRRLARLDLESGLWTVLSGDSPWDVESFDLSADGSLIAYFLDEDGISRLHLLSAVTGAELPAPELPAGVAGAPHFRPRGHEVAFDLGWARSPSDVWSWDADAQRLERWTASEIGGLPAERFVLPQLVHYPTFDDLPAADKRQPPVRRTVPAFVYKPAGERFKPPYPVYVGIHGGPESQFRPDFQGSNNFLLDELGVALIYPNVRGSAGYGKSYLALDDGARREDSVKDVGALLDWIATQPDLDASRVMVGGGSYGGYMALATSVLYSDRLRAAFDYVGISNFVTFLTNTQDYRRDLRRAEYGDERDPEMRRALEEISPANHADRIKQPLLVAQGANDPRVPVTESDQIVAAVAAAGVPVWYLVAADEGHGFRRKSNTDYLRAVWIEFIRRYLLGTASGG